MARKRKFYRITTTQFEILASAAEDFASDHPGIATDHITAVINEICAAHAPKVSAKTALAVACERGISVDAGVVAEIRKSIETAGNALDAAVAANAAITAYDAAVEAAQETLATQTDDFFNNGNAVDLF